MQDSLFFSFAFSLLVIFTSLFVLFSWLYIIAPMIKFRSVWTPLVVWTFGGIDSSYVSGKIAQSSRTLGQLYGDRINLSGELLNVDHFTDQERRFKMLSRAIKKAHRRRDLLFAVAFLSGHGKTAETAMRAQKLNLTTEALITEDR